MLQKIPAVVSFNKSVTISHGLFFNKYQNHVEPLAVIESGWVGPQNTIKETSSNNIGVTESAFLSHNTNILKINFSFYPLNMTQGLNQVNNNDEKVDNDVIINEFIDSINDYYNRAIQSKSVDIIAKMVANNIFNARWTYRNRVNAKNIMVRVTVGDRVFEENTFLSLNQFDMENKNVVELGDLLASNWKGETNHTIHISAELDMGMVACEVYPSENYVSNSPHKILHKIRNVFPEERDTVLSNKIMGQATFRNAKIWNALRTIDIWYPEYEMHNIPIAVEPVGSNLKLNKKFRNCKDTNLFDMMLRLDEIDPESNDGLFVTMCFIQGGLLTDRGKR